MILKKEVDDVESPAMTLVLKVSHTSRHVGDNHFNVVTQHRHGHSETEHRKVFERTNFHLYKFTLVQKLSEEDYDRRGEDEWNGVLAVDC